jgi:recombinase
MYGARVSRRRQRRKERRELRHAAPRRRDQLSVSSRELLETDVVRRLAYTRRQAAEALGVSVQTIDQRVVPAIETVKTEWGMRLIPVSELERYLAERRDSARPRRAKPRSSGRPAAVPDEIVNRIQAAHARGKSLGEIARDLNACGVPTAQGGRRWWPSTVRSILVRRSR